MVSKVNVRVYGICISPGHRVLVTDEYQLGMYMTKFPGGGLEPGEGTLDCLRRECREELGQEIVVKAHFYTTDYFQPTFLLPEPQQLISIYYLIDIPEPHHFRLNERPFDFPPEQGMQGFRWIPLEKLTEDAFTFPVDKLVAGKLKAINDSLA